ncbi:MAG: DegV family protein [Candidatus Heimdallarchaeota archaeon]
MSKIKIVVDSTSDLPKDLAEKYDIEIIPLNIFFGEDRYKDKVDLSPSEFYGMVESGIYEWPKTSQPSAKEFLEVYTKIFDQGYETIFSIHITPNMSGTMNSVQLAINQIPEKDIIAVDGNTTSLPLGLIALIAGKLNQEGKNKEEILSALKNTLIPKSRIVCTLDTLEYLHRGGRIGRAKKIFGKLLNKKPIMQVRDGLVESFVSVTGSEEAYNGMVRIAPKIIENMDYDILWIGYTNDKSLAEKYYDSIKDIPNLPKDVALVEMGPSIGAHIGTWCTHWHWGISYYLDW